MLSDDAPKYKKLTDKLCLNAPYGAWRFLTWGELYMSAIRPSGLNAPYGAWCFLTPVPEGRSTGCYERLNAPYGARCFLTGKVAAIKIGRSVLMHLMALGAF